MAVPRCLVVGPRALCAAVFCLAAVGCKTKPCDPNVDDCPSDSGPPVEICTSPDAGLNNPQCQLTLGTPLLDFIAGPTDQNWYSFQTPATVDARTLVHVTAGYNAPGTPVDLTVGIYKSDGTTSVYPSTVDNHGAGAPKPIDIIFPFAQASTRLLISANDVNFNKSVNPSYDLHNQYAVVANVLEDPDPNLGLVPITLSPTNGYLAGSAYGFLSVPGRVDTFTVKIPSTGRQILYLHLTGGCSADGGQTGQCVPPPNYQMSYTLLDPQGLTLATDYMKNVFLPIDLATSRLVPVVGTADTYQINVQGWVNPQTGLQPLGDVRVRYDLAVEVLPDLDMNEPNDSLSTATPVNFGSPSAPGTAAQVKTGRISYVPDPDWFAVNLQPSGVPTVLYYKVTPTTNGGRFAPLTGPPFTRQFLAFQQVFTGTSASDRTNKCITDPTVCPQGYDPDQVDAQLNVQTYCQLYDPPDSGIPRCLLADREEHPAYVNLRNFEGAIPVPPHASAAQYLLVVQSLSNAWADDLDYQLTLEWRTNVAEEPFYSGGVKQTKVKAMTRDATYSVVPSNATVLTGTLGYGYGRLNNNNPNDGGGIRGPQDYDGTPTQIDSYELDFPGGLPPPQDQAWELVWDVTNDSNGQVVHDLSLQTILCDTTQGGSTPPCPVGAPVLGNGGKFPNIIYDPGAGQWFNSLGQYGPRQQVYNQTVTAGAITTTALDDGCFCFQRPFIAAGKFFINVQGVDRDSYNPATYTVKTALGPYPQPFQNVGVNYNCPPPLVVTGGYDGGCGFQ